MNALTPPPTKPGEQLIQEAMQALGGQATAEDLLDYATPDDSPIHNLFDWNDANAAHRFRLDQARGWIRRVKVVFESTEDEQSEGRAFTAVYTEDEAPLRTYMPTAAVMGTEDLAEQAMQEAYRGLQGWEKRYRYLNSFPAFQQRFGAVLAAIGAAKP